MTRLCNEDYQRPTLAPFGPSFTAPDEGEKAQRQSHCRYKVRVHQWDQKCLSCTNISFVNFAKPRTCMREKCIEVGYSYLLSCLHCELVSDGVSSRLSSISVSLSSTVLYSTRSNSVAYSKAMGGPCPCLTFL